MLVNIAKELQVINDDANLFLQAVKQLNADFERPSTLPFFMFYCGITLGTAAY